MDYFIDLPKKEIDKPIYRIFELHHFLECISKDINVLVAPAKWDDPFENFFLKSKCIDEMNQEISLNEFLKSWYGQCWTRNKDSDAMWRIYSKNKLGICVETTPRKLIDSNKLESHMATQKFFISKVIYHSKASISNYMKNTSLEDVLFGGQNQALARLLSIKRKEFKHEKEIRFLYSYEDSDPYEHAKRNLKKQIISLETDWKSCISKILLDPRLSNPIAESIKKVITTTCSYLNGKIKKSTLYESPSYKISLSK